MCVCVYMHVCAAVSIYMYVCVCACVLPDTFVKDVEVIICQTFLLEDRYDCIVNTVTAAREKYKHIKYITKA